MVATGAHGKTFSALSIVREDVVFYSILFMGFYFICFSLQRN